MCGYGKEALPKPAKQSQGGEHTSRVPSAPGPSSKTGDIPMDKCVCVTHRPPPVTPLNGFEVFDLSFYIRVTHS